MPNPQKQINEGDRGLRKVPPVSIPALPLEKQDVAFRSGEPAPFAADFQWLGQTTSHRFSDSAAIQSSPLAYYNKEIPPKCPPQTCSMHFCPLAFRMPPIDPATDPRNNQTCSCTRERR
jgi:hypothetical protein